MKNSNENSKTYRLTPLKIAIIYAFVSLLWILFSDLLLAFISDDPEFLTRVQSYKGIAFVLFTAALIFILTRKALKQIILSQQALRESRKRYREIFDAPSEAIFIHDAKTGDIIDVNKAMLNMFEFKSKNEILNKSVAHLSSDSEEFSKKAAFEKINAAASGNPQHFEWVSKKKNGELFPSEVTLRRIVITGRECVVAVLRDISKRKLVEQESAKLTEQLYQSRKMEAVGQLAGGVAHDFNNMLNGISGAAELIRIKKNDPEKVTEYADLITKSVNNAANLTNQLLTFSRKTKKTSSTIDVKKIILDTISLLKRTINKAVTISFENRAQRTNITGDDYLIQNCLINMGINSNHATMPFP